MKTNDTLKDNYYRRARVTDIHDGDTLTLEVDLGFCCYREVDVRLEGVFAPEIVGPEKKNGELVKKFVVDWVTKREQNSNGRWQFLLQSSLMKTKEEQQMTFTRYVGKIYDLNGECLNAAINQEQEKQI